MTYHVLVIFVRLIGFLLFGLGVLVGGLWILVEAANAVAAGGDSVWYLALAFTLLPALIFAFDIARTRSEMAIFFTVASLALVDEPGRLEGCIDAAGDWLAIGFDPRPDRLAAFAWHRPTAPSAESLVGELADRGVSRLLLSHGGSAAEGAAFARLVARYPSMELSVAGGVGDLDGVRRLRDAGVASLILGEALLSGAIDFEEAARAADPAQ